MVKRVRKYGTVKTVRCVKTSNRCFGQVVYEDIETDDLGVIVNSALGSDFVDIDTYIKIRRFWESEEKQEVATMKMFIYGTDDLITARRIDVAAYGRGVWEAPDGEWYVMVMMAGGRYFMALADFAVDRRHIERMEATVE